MLANSLACLAFTLVGACCLSSCVVSTYGPTGSSPEIPLPPQPSEPAQEAPTSGPSEIEAKHILISYKGAMRAAPYIKRTKAQAQLLATEIQEKATSGEDFAKLAEKHSDDPGSAANGGSLGRFNRKQMVPEFSEAAFALPVGGVSGVVESPFGFHVIQRTD